MTGRPRIGLSSYPREVDIATGPTLLHTVSRFYVDSIVRAGGLPLAVPVLPPELAADAVAGLDGLVLSGGGDVEPARYGHAAAEETAGVDVDRDASEVALVAAAIDARLPRLAVCRGVQILNVALGGTLVQHVPRATGHRHSWASRSDDTVHAVRLEPGCRLATVLGTTELEVNSLHHQAVDAVGRGVRAVGWSPDGTVEAIEVDGHPEVLAVQWHPELLAGVSLHQALFSALVGAARARLST